MGCGVGCFPGLFLGILTRMARFELPVSPSVFRPLFFFFVFVFFFFFFFFEVGAAKNEAAAPESTKHGGGAGATWRRCLAAGGLKRRRCFGLVRCFHAISVSGAQESFVDTAETG